MAQDLKIVAGYQVLATSYGKIFHDGLRIPGYGRRFQDGGR